MVRAKNEDTFGAGFYNPFIREFAKCRLALSLHELTQSMKISTSSSRGARYPWAQHRRSTPGVVNRMNIYWS